jgi:hypothetical protein
MKSVSNDSEKSTRSKNENAIVISIVTFLRAYEKVVCMKENQITSFSSQ